MRKMLICCFIFMVLLCITFKVKNNKLNCEYKVDYDDIKIVNTISFNFKDNTYKQIDKMTFDSESSASSYFNDLSDYIDLYNLSLVGKSIISEIDENIDSDTNRKEMKEKYESYHYTCR